MSTKIYNGYWIPNMTMTEFNEFIVRVRNAFREYVDKNLRHLIASFATSIVDDIVYRDLNYALKCYARDGNPENASDWLFWAAYDQIEDRFKRIKGTGERDPIVDFNAELVIFANSQIPDKMLCILYEDGKFTKIWRKMPEVHEYHYQNQCDKPHNISETNWKKRRNEWDIVLGDLGIPAETGISITINDDLIPLFILHKKPIDRYVPSAEKRAWRLADMIVMDECFGEYKPLEDSTSDNRMDVYWACRDYLRTDEGKARITAKATEVLPLIVPIKQRKQSIKEYATEIERRKVACGLSE